MIRVALWLMQEVGEGNTFTKEQLRQAFPGVSQIDRRMRDLRPFDWVILTNIEDVTLSPEDQRFVRPGVPVWDPDARRKAVHRRPISARQRQEVLARDQHMCTLCGISGAEPYIDDSNQTAVLSVRQRDVVLPGGEVSTALVTECKRCSSGATGAPLRADEVLAAIKTLDPSEQRRLSRWMERGRRGSTPLERAWNGYRLLPPAAQDAVRSRLEAS